MKIFLIGLPGSGKSTLGNKLARSLEISFYDLDVLVEEHEKRTVPEIFSDSGETYFRRLEKFCLEEFLRIPQNAVLATGGGTPCFYNNMALMKAAGPVVFLDVAVKEIASRFELNGPGNRPLFFNKTGFEGIEVQLTKLLTERISFYRQADIVFRGESVQELEQLIHQQS